MSRRLLPTILLILIVFAAQVTLAACQSGYLGTMETITVAVPPLEQNALLYIASERGFFPANGLKVSVKNFESGPASINALLKGQADFAEAAEFPVVMALFRQQPIQVVVTNDKFENDYIVARKDRGIEQVADLRGKRIGVARQTINEFYLGRFLQLNGVQLQQVTLVNLAPAQFVNSIVSGDVDAVIAWQPYIYQARTKRPDLIVWPAQSSQLVYGLLVSRAEWLTSHGDTARRFIQALQQAEDYAVAHPDEAKAIVQQELRYDSTYVAGIWPQHHYALSLDFSLIAAMTDEAHWIIDNGLAPATTMPDFSNFIYTTALTAVKPEAVTIGR